MTQRLSGNQVDSESRDGPNLYIVGFMGTGKSSVGRFLAREFQMTYIDSDREIETAAGEKIEQIFKEKGEPYFRELERRLLEEGHPQSGCVVSCGGGMMSQPGVPELLNRMGVVICLFASVQTIIKRTSANRSRPLLNVEDPAERIRSLLKERESDYRKSGIGISTDNRSVQEVAGHAARIYSSKAKSFQK